jgi:BirA family biotin operon repressor/biotin-[acetyl-CoA-carboxylase] ligase
VPQETAPFQPFDATHVRRALAGSAFSDIRYQNITGSTNDDAALLLGRADAAGATLVAGEQTAGRGRKAGRAWIAPPGSGLLFTTIVPATLRAADLWCVPFWVALCVADGIGRACGAHVDLRWPNDCFLHDRKVGGILCVSRLAGETAHVGCGVGINVTRAADATLAGIAPPPAFLADDAPHVLREVLLVEILLAFERRLGALHTPSIVASTYEERAQLNGSGYRVRLDRDGSTLDGTALGLGPDGTLRLHADGREQTVALADVQRL